MVSRCIFNNLTVGCWNIEGAMEKVNSSKLNKIEDPVFKNILKTFDILCLQETHLSQDDDTPNCNGYVSIPHCRKLSGNNIYFGGMLVYIKTSIRSGARIRRNFDDDALEITLLKNFFGLDKDIKILFTYASPINSCYTKARTTNMLDKIETHFIDGGDNFIIMGDLNGRTKLGEDFVRDYSDDHSPINVPFYKKDSYLKRRNMDDHIIDAQGKLILEICKNSTLRILNGRTIGDTSGKFTRYPVNLFDKPSVIDYAICSQSLLEEIPYFMVLPYNGMSDHCCISLKIKTNVLRNNLPHTKGIEEKAEVNNSVSKHRYTYDKRRKHIYEKSLQDDGNIKILSRLLDRTQINSENIEEGISQLNDILLRAAKKSCFIKRFKSQRKHKKDNTNNWFNKECKARRDILRQYSKNLSITPFDRTKRQRFLTARSTYKKVCKKAEKTYRRNLTDKLKEIGHNDPKTFWSIISRMNNWGKNQTDPADNITIDKWVRHFEGLLNDKTTTKTSSHTQTNGNTFDPILDGRISYKELKEGLAQLKVGKAPGPDEILGEYLKIFGNSFGSILLKLIRFIFAEHIYPSKWNVNFLKPIYKKGEKTDPDNCRGLAIGSIFGKLFSIILLNRLMVFIKQKQLISPHQIGFMKDSGTPDHIFLLQTIIEKVVKKGKKRLYAAFIDFKKAYDTVNRELLLQRLKSLGINGIFLRNIAAMYTKIEYSVKHKNGHSSNIRSNLGLKQGCPLSPMLFNIYIDDIKDVFDESCCPINFQNETINHFLYADDLVLISESSEALQNSLDKVYQFTNRKHLTISVKKSKSMVFNQAGRVINNPFNLNNETLEQVQSFCYLGVDIKCSGTVKHPMNILCDKANKALRPLLCAIARFKIPAKTSIRLFHTFISPILLYNAENWAILSDKGIKNFDNNTILDDTCGSKIDVVHRKLLKFILGVSKSSPSIAIYGDTGEVPVSLKSYRLALNFWHRVSSLPDTYLVKKALLENIELRTNWIITIEKLINRFNLADKIGNHKKFKKITKNEIDKTYLNYWKTELTRGDIPRLAFYREIKEDFKIENYLHIANFENRRAIAKIRCSSHSLEIEKGRHKNIPRTERICKLCDKGEIESEQHFLLKCDKYDTLKNKYEIHEYTSVLELLNNVEQDTFGKYLIEAVALREDTLRPKPKP